MAHYALIDTNTSLVVQVFVGRNENDLAQSITNWETYYAPRGMLCKRTSYNTYGGQHLLGGTPFRYNYAGIGYTYDAGWDAFVPPRPYPSWTLNTDTFQWQPPIPYPTDGGMYTWDEDTQTWEPVDA